jgi:hypothetical protein
MVVVRTVFHARQGKINQLVTEMKQATHDAPNRPLILTDLSGPTNTMVMEQQHESLTAYEQWRAELFRSEAFQAGQSSMDEAIESAAVEFYTVEQA